MAAVIPGGKYRSQGTILAGTDETVVLAPLSGSWAFVTNLSAATADGSASTLTAAVFKKTTALAYTLFFEKVIPANDSLNYEFMPLELNNGDELRVIGAAGTHVVVSFIGESRNNT